MSKNPPTPTSVKDLIEDFCKNYLIEDIEVEDDDGNPVPVPFIEMMTVEEDSAEELQSRIQGFAENLFLHLLEAYGISPVETKKFALIPAQMYIFGIVIRAALTGLHRLPKSECPDYYDPEHSRLWASVWSDVSRMMDRRAA